MINLIQYPEFTEPDPMNDARPLSDINAYLYCKQENMLLCVYVFVSDCNSCHTPPPFCLHECTDTGAHTIVPLSYFSTDNAVCLGDV